MIDQIDIVVGGKRFDDLVTGLDFVGRSLEEAVDKAIAKTPPMLLKSLRTVAKNLDTMHGQAWNGSVFNSSDRLQSRSGEGLRSIYNSIKLVEQGGTVIAASISPAKMSIHETGGTIRASGAGYLTIPLPAAMDGRGIPLRQRAREWDHTFTKRSKKGNLLIFRRLPGANALTPLYILKRQVTIRPRLRMEPVLMEEMGYFDNRLFEQISNAIDRMM